MVKKDIDFDHVEESLVYVDQSSIHGRGLFAKKKIKKGTLLGHVIGKPAKRDGDYVLWVDESTGVRVTNALKFINHDERPNAAYLDDLTVITLKNIKKGEEITHNYEADQEV